MPDNTSASGGYLLPVTPPNGPAPLEGEQLYDFFQALIAGITGLSGKMIRPAFQAVPPVVPSAGDAWASFRIASRPSDAFPAMEHIVDEASPEGFDRLLNNEIINIVATFYDLGNSGLADTYATMLRDGLQIPQNLEVLTNANMGLNSVGEPVDVPVLLKDRWQYRVDLPFMVARQIVRDYRVESVVEANGALVTDAGIVLNIKATEPEEPSP